MKKTKPAPATEMRCDAESRLKGMPSGRKSVVNDQKSEADTRRLVYELQIHQMELEMQNEELRASQAELESSRARYLDLYDFAPVGYCTLSEQGLVLDANLTATTLLGTARSALVRQPISRFILKDDHDIYHLHRNKLFETGEPQECELRLVKPDGAIFWAHLTAIASQTEDGAPVCRVALMDITANKQAVEEMRASEARYRELFANSRDAIMTLEPPAWTFTSGNPAALAMFGARTEAEFTAHEPWELSPERQPDGRASGEKAREMIETAMRDGSNFFEWTHRRINGEEFPADVLLSRVSAAGTTFLQATVRDITDRRRMEKELEQSRQMLRGLLSRLEIAREEERTRIARDIHDDLGQNLTAIKMDLRWIERALEKMASPELDAVKAHAASAIEIVSTTTATVQELATQLRPGVLDNLGLGPAIRFECRRFHTRSGIPCRTGVPDTLPEPAPAVATALFRILQECLTNVARHSGATRTSIRLDRRGSDFLLRVHDNGTGITDEALALPQSLGLLGMKERAAMLGGEVVFQRGRKGGTVVTVRIPAGAVIGDQQPVIGGKRL